MPKILTSAMRAHLDLETTRLAAIWRITRKDGAQFFFTDHDRDIVFGGETSAPAPARPLHLLTLPRLCWINPFGGRPDLPPDGADAPGWSGLRRGHHQAQRRRSSVSSSCSR
jgi:hypothetical protein